MNVHVRNEFLVQKRISYLEKKETFFIILKCRIVIQKKKKLHLYFILSNKTSRQVELSWVNLCDFNIFFFFIKSALFWTMEIWKLIDFLRCIFSVLGMSILVSLPAYGLETHHRMSKKKKDNNMRTPYGTLENGFGGLQM